MMHKRKFAYQALKNNTSFERFLRTKWISLKITFSNFKKKYIENFKFLIIY